jgi:hypothetical protein
MPTRLARPVNFAGQEASNVYLLVATKREARGGSCSWLWKGWTMPTQIERLADLIRQFLEDDQGEAAPAQVVAALATVGNGHLRTSAGVGLPRSARSRR